MAKMAMAVVIIASTIAAAPASSEYDAAILGALSLPAKDALRELDSLSRAQGAPGWVRAKSLKLLGDHQFMKADYKKSADFYRQASKFDNSSMYKFVYALALAADGQTGAAREILGAIVGDGADVMSGEASLLLQEIAPAGQPPIPPAPLAEPSVKSDNKQNTTLYNSQATSSNSQGKTPEISQNVPNADPKSIDNKQNATVQVQQATSSNQQTVQVQQVATSNPQQKVTLYTVQVGAFGSVENAENLYKKLSSTYSDITISPTTSGDQTLYRVRIGTFENRDDAAAFADKLITTAGLSARVFEK
jgi:cell division septation protein DedD